MKCNKCNREVIVGDQICIHCGAKLVVESSIPLEIFSKEKVTKKSTFLLTIATIGVILFILLILIFMSKR